MTAAAVHDALAAWLGELSAVRVVYGDGSVNSAVKPWPGKVIEMPAVLVRRGSTERSVRPLQRYRREWEADFYLPIVGNAADSTQRINALDDQLLDKMRTNLNLDGTVSYCNYLGSNAPTYIEEGEDEAVIQYLVWTARFETEERASGSYSVERT